MKILLRLKLEGCQVLEFDPEMIRTLRVFATDEGDYCCSVANDSQEFILCTGTFDECHMMLNSIHNKLDVDVIDI